MSVRKAILVGLLLAIAGQFAYAEEASESVDKVCINSRLVKGFNALDDQHIFIEERMNEFYLITLRSRCLGLDFVHAIGFKDTTSRICSKGFGEIVYRDRVSRQLEKCFIDTIEPVVSKDEAKEIIAAREEEKEMAKDRE